MTYLFLVSFGIGLLMGVRAMLHGIERPAKVRQPRRAAGSRPPGGGREGQPAAQAGAQSATRPPSRFAINLPTTAGFATVFGVTGYLLARYTTLAVTPELVIAALAGAVGGAGVLALVAAWAIPAIKAEVIDERYVLQGAFAQVISVADHGASGTITYQADGATHTSPATGLDGARLDLGAEVVIERIEDGLAYVEPWARVEARL